MDTLTYHAWMVVLPGKKKTRRTIGWEGQSPEEVWNVALLWPSEAELEKAKKKGAYITQATITYEEHHAPD